MKLIFSKSPILAVAVIVALAAGTALVAGYVDGPSRGTAVTADSECTGCPKAGTEECPKVNGTCDEEGGAFASTSGESTCATEAASGCCPEKAAACPVKGEASGCPAMAETACGTGGCPISQ